MAVRRGGIGIGGIIVVLAISYFTGINPLALLGGYEMLSGGSGSGTTTTEPHELTPQEKASGDFVRAVLGSTEDVWTAVFASQGRTYRDPKLVLFSGATRSGCGMAQTAMGPFYCPLDQTVYLDTEFFSEMRSRFDACPETGGQNACAFAQAYVIAHEIGHHVQNLTGILSRVETTKQQMNQVQANALQVRTELQADCLAGVWANKAEQRFTFIQPGDVQAALQTANAIGDDMLQRETQGYVVPDSFTHGTSAQREHWFMTGLQNGALESCNTFGNQNM